MLVPVLAIGGLGVVAVMGVVAAFIITGWIGQPVPVLGFEQTFDQPDAECCYARSTKTWVRDPDAVAWETFVTHNEITHFGQDLGPDEAKESTAGSRCCA